MHQKLTLKKANFYEFGADLPNLHAVNIGDQKREIKTRQMASRKTFKEINDFETRKTLAQRIRAKYPHRIPIIAEKAKGSFDIPTIDKKKFLTPEDSTVGMFIHGIRSQLKLKPEQSIFLFINNVLPPVGSPMSNMYEKYKDIDGFLYITYSGENTFGYYTL